MPAALFAAATPAAARAAGLVLAPFGWPQILAAHLLAALPLSLLLGAVIRRTLSPLAALALGIVLGGATAWLTLAGGATVGPQANPLDRLALRVGWCVLLQLPWCLLQADGVSLLRLPGWAAGALVLSVAVVLPVVYTRTLAAEQTRRVQELMARGRWVRAKRLVESLPDLISPPSLSRTVQQLRHAAANPMPNAVVRRASVLAALDRLDEAADLLRPLADTDPAAALLLADLDQDQQRGHASDARYRAVLALLARMPSSDQVKLWRVDAYDGLAFNARERKDFAAAAAIYRQALASVPGAEGYYHFQLGRQLHQAGRSAEALTHLDAAARHEPQTYGPAVAPLVNDIRLNSTSCLLSGLGGHR